GNRIFTFGVTGLGTCFDTTSGKQLWQGETHNGFHAPTLLFGASCSPLLAGDKVLVNVGSKEASIVAFQKDTGKVAWKSQDDLASYSSPIRIGEGEAEQVVFLTGSRLLSLKPTDGALLWDYPLKDDLFESSTTPIRVGDMLIAGSITFGSVGLKLETKDNKPSVREIWKNRVLTCYFSTPVAVGKEHIYM